MIHLFNRGIYQLYPLDNLTTNIKVCLLQLGQLMVEYYWRILEISTSIQLVAIYGRNILELRSVGEPYFW